MKSDISACSTYCLMIHSSADGLWNGEIANQENL
jgi:hypothetical protein